MTNNHDQIESKIRMAIEAGASWLICNQNGDGGWGPIPRIRSDSANTALALHALALLDKFRENKNRAMEWVINAQATDGGWGLYFDTENTTFCTANLILALQLLNFGDSPSTRKGSDWLINAQNRDGSWGLVKNSEGTIHETFLTLRVLKEEENIRKKLEKGLNWLLHYRKQDGGWGAIRVNTSDAHLTSEIIGFLYGLDAEIFKTKIRLGIEWLKKHQKQNGAWTITPPTFNNNATQFYNLLICNEDIDNKYMQRTLNWVLNKQLKNGAWATQIRGKQGTANATSMSIKALLLALEKIKHKRSLLSR